MNGIPLETVVCNLCGGRRTKVRFQSADPWASGAHNHFAATTDKFGLYGAIVECLDCGLVFTNPRPPAATLLSGYEHSEDPDYEAEKDSRSINAHMALATIRRHAPGGRLLEIGCANGFFLNAARMSYEVFGVEPSRWSRDHARDTLRLNVPAATLEEAEFPAAHFDVIAMVDVIEHVPDPLSMLTEAARINRPGGILYIVTPDVASLSARVLRGRWWGLRPAHVYYFARATLQRMLEQAGYEVIEIRSYGRIFTWGYWVTRLSNFPSFVRTPIAAFVRALRLQDKFLYLDTRDSMQVIARRK